MVDIWNTSLCALIAAWLDYCQRSEDGIQLNRFAWNQTVLKCFQCLFPVCRTALEAPRRVSRTALGRRRNSGHPKGYVGRALGTTFMWLTPTITPFERYNLTFKDSKYFIVHLKQHIKNGIFFSYTLKCQ